MTQDTWNPMAQLAKKQETDQWWPPLEWSAWSKRKVGGQVVYALVNGIEDPSTVDASDPDVIKTVNHSIQNRKLIDAQGSEHPINMGILSDLGRKEMERRRASQ